MEALRDLPYDSLATQTGAIFPPGNIPDTETDVRDSIVTSRKMPDSHHMSWSSR